MPDWEIGRLKGECCLIWFEPDGKRRRYRLGTKDYREAEAKAPARYAALTRPADTKIRSLWAAYISEKSGRPIAVTMSHTGKAILPHFGSLDPDEILYETCTLYTKSRREAGRNDGAIHTELGHLAMVLHWAVKRRHISIAPHIERPKKPEPKTDHYTREEVEKMLCCGVAPHVVMAIRIMTRTAARLSAVLELTWDQVDFDKGLIYLRNQFDPEVRKKRAIVPMADSLWVALLEAREAALSRYVVEYHGRPIKSLKTGFKAVSHATGIKPVSAHKFRHTAAVWLVEGGHSIESVGQYLGHTNPSITYSTYARFSPNYMRDLAQTLDGPAGEAISYEVDSGSANLKSGT